MLNAAHALRVIAVTALRCACAACDCCPCAVHKARTSGIPHAHRTIQSPPLPQRRYGLCGLAEDNLTDLLAGARHHAAAGCAPAYWLCVFAGLAAAPWAPRLSSGGGGGSSSGSSSGDEGLSAAGESGGGRSRRGSEARSSAGRASDAGSGGDGDEGASERGGTVDTEQSGGAAAAGPSQGKPGAPLRPQRRRARRPRASAPPRGGALDFYVFCCAQLAHPGAVSCLFPEAGDAAPLVRAAPAQDAVRAVFRWVVREWRTPGCAKASACRLRTLTCAAVVSHDM